jgi:hypothetical protein
MSAEAPFSVRPEDFPTPVETQDQSLGLRQKLSRIAAAGLLMLGAAENLADETPAHAAASPVVVGMPFDGKWAYSDPTTAACGAGSDQTSHPSCHETYFGDWSTDLYAAAGTEVKLNAGSDKNLSFSWDTTASGSCGQTRMINVFADGTNVGRVYFTHLTDAASTANDPSNGMVIGKIANLSCNPGGSGKHIHVEFDNAGSNTHSCYTNHSNSTNTAGIALGAGTSLGQLGSTNTGTKEVCSTESAPILPTDQFSLVSRTPNTIDAIDRAPDGKLVDLWWDSAAGWHTTELPGATGATAPASDPKAISRSSGSIDAFYRDVNGRLVDEWWDAGTGWHNTVLPGVGGAPIMVGDAAPVSRGANSMDVFYRNAAGQLVDEWWDGANWYNQVIYGMPVMAGNPKVISRSSTTMDVLFRDIDNRLVDASWTPTTGWNYAVLPDTSGAKAVAGDPSPISRTPSTLDVVYRTPSGQLIDEWYDPAAGGWHNYVIYGTPVVQGDPKAISRSPSSIDVVYKGTDTITNNLLIDTWWDASIGWHSTILPGTTGNHAVSGNPTPIARTGTSMDVLYRNTNGTVTDEWWDASAGWHTNQVG